MLPVLIMSYMGNAAGAIQKRVQAHARQLEWLLAADSRIEVFVVAQAYHPRWYCPWQRVHYVERHDGPVPRSPGKNRLLAEFYASDNDWALLADNDAILYPHQLGGGIFTHMLDHLERWQGVDCWVPLNPMAEPFNYLYREQEEKFDRNVVMVKTTPNIKGSLVAVRNTRKTGGREIYFREDGGDFMGERAALASGDDAEFFCEQVVAGHAVYKCQSAVLHEFAIPTTLEGVSDAEGRRRQRLESQQRLAARYREHGITLAPGRVPGSFKWNMRDFYARNWSHPDELLVRR